MDIRESIVQYTDVHKIIEQLSELLQKSIILENDQFELIAYSSPNERMFDPIQQSTILAKRCPLFVIERLKKEGIIERLKTSNKPVRMQAMDDIEFYQRVVISVKYRDTLYGYLWIYETTELTDDEFSLLTTTAPYIGNVLYEKDRTKEVDMQLVIWKMINGDYPNKVELQHDLELVSYALPSCFTIIIASVTDPNYLHSLTRVKKIMIDRKIAYYLGKGTEIVGIIDHSEEQEIKQTVTKIINDIELQLSEEEKAVTFIGTGNVYTDSSAIRKSYLEALEAIEMMVFLNVSQLHCSFEELGVFRYIKLMYKKNMTEQYRNRKIVTLMEHDKLQKTELLETLWFFVKNNCRVGVTADELYIHSNTLAYRIRQINNLTTINFDDAHERTELYMELSALYNIPTYKAYYEEVINYKERTT